MANSPICFKFFEIELAFELVSAGVDDQEAFLCLDSGDILYFSDLGDSDDPPEDFDFSDRYLAIPSKRDLNLGRNVVFDFVDAHAAHLSEEVHGIFSRRGAYGQFKSLLRRDGIDDLWHEFESDRETSAIRKWCRENGVLLDQERG